MGLAEPRGRAGRARPVPRRDCGCGDSLSPGAQLFPSEHQRLGRGQIPYNLCTTVNIFHFRENAKGLRFFPGRHLSDLISVIIFSSQF